ncbi:hypothetical protein ABMA28_004116 [Loxostege sticticalis]|uniref:Transcriptional regulator ATRX homolog n=1 Tax=Loxostege sticticalis TaxID=481309 RepID=A0ABD0SUA7_LOXSC
MADDVPVCDVLCEAMEYLSKLGSNLRARSENLKEKRIRKEKLKNYHAVQKAADKVLLICQLSKKSLDNVECGVRKVLTLLNQGQSSLGVDAPTPEKSEKYQYFKYRSHKLKIAKKVPVKHYMSVRVMARKMPSSMQDKYPVYYNCKLYRRRKQKEKNSVSEEGLEDDNAKSETLDKEKKSDRVLQSPSKNEDTVHSESDDHVVEMDTSEKSCVDAEKSSKFQSDKKPESSYTIDSGFRGFEVSDESSKSASRNKSLLSESIERSIGNDGSSKNSYSREKRLSSVSSGRSKDDDSSPKKSESVDGGQSSDSHRRAKNHDEITKKSISRDKRYSSESHDMSKVHAESSNKSQSKEKRRASESRKGSKDDETLKMSKSRDKRLSSESLRRSKDGNESSRKSESNNKRKSTESCQSEDADKTSKKSGLEGKRQSSESPGRCKDNSDDEIPRLSKINNKSKFKNIRVIDDDSSENSNDLNSSNKASNNTQSNNKDSLDNCESDSSIQLHKSKKIKLITSDTEEVEDAKKENTKTTNAENSSNEEKSNDSESVKPLIKCVSLTKLLKPDVLTKVETLQSENKVSSTKGTKKEEKKSSKNKENLRHRNKIDNYLTKQPTQSDEEFWVQKRKEVSAFIAKKFCINVTRLPEFSQSFLQLHDLKRITQSERVICELTKEKEVTDGSSSKEVDHNPEHDGNAKETVPDNMNVVKSALLNDSDSDKSDFGDKSPSPIAEIAETVKNALLNDSDEDETNKNETQEGKECQKENSSTDIRNDPEQIKNVLLNDSESDKNEEESDNVEEENSKKSQLKQDFSKIKKTLLNESDSEKNETAESEIVNKDNDTANNNQDLGETQNVQQDKSKDDQEVDPPNEDQEQNSKEPETLHGKFKKHKEGKPKSRRKHIMESMHAKKMLLTYSSSSDTEDEQLRNALKEIKHSLLEGSDDEKKKEKEKKIAKNSSSDSEEDILATGKKNKGPKEDCSTAESESEAAKHKLDTESEKSCRKRDGSSSDDPKPKKKMGRSRAQPGGSSQNSDSQDDKDIDGLTNLNSLNKNRRRRGSTSTDKTDTNSISSNKKMPKAPLISQEDMLQPESSSEAGSVVESDGGEELPTISLTGLNGSGVDHLAKDDLLGESDTSASHNENEKEDKKMTDSDEETTLKSKRRKAHATISSDSEAGSSRKKDFIDMESKLSDFEDSEDDGSSEPTKKKRRKKAVDSDASVGSSSNDESKKKRRRIKQLNDSDGSGSDTENEGKNKHGRKNIRKVMGKNQLEEATKKAAREEKERIARIAERQKLYNNLEFDESGKPDEVVLEKVVLDFDPETKKPLIEVDRGLVKKLKPHQANGIKFMWDACFESAKRIKKDRGSGCILAHCMGLGKTLQVVSLTHTLLTHSELTNVHRVLVVCPLSTVLNWVNEFRMWLKHSERDFDVDVYELSRYKQNSERAFQLQQWFEHGGVCVLGYEMFRNLSADNPKKFKKKMLKNFQQSLVDPGPDLVVCDEGHLLKNEKTSLSQSMNRVKTLRRIVLTGTPLQNNLKEYYCMVQFVKPNLLGKYNEYLNRFVNPITNGQYTDSTEHDIRIMKRRSHVLHKMLDGAVQRRDYGVLAPFLPPKHEYVLFITLSEVQCKLYQFYLDNYSRRPLPGKSSGFLFPDFQSLQRIWTHPLVLKYNSERYEIMQQKKREREEEDSEGSLVDFIDDDSTPDESSTEESSDDLSDMSDDSRKKSKKKKAAKKSKAKDSKVSTRRGTRANPVEMEDEEQNEVVELKRDENPTEWWIKLVTEDELEDMRHSHKLVLLFDILRQCETIGDKLLVFSQSLYSLDLIEHFLGKVDEATQEGRIDEKLGGHVGSWSPGVDYFRLDGSTSCENRSIWCKNFNREDNPRARLFLISTRAGGLGINLVAANRVVIFDVSWNPSHDVQSIFRVYRFGQKKPCYIYRFLAMGTMEEKIYERQVTKQAISKRVIDEQQIDRHYAENDLAELYKFEPTPPQPRPLPPLPKDRLFAEMLREHETQIYKYHEHDSLLENKEEETLSEEERKAAWEDFENEKNRPPPAPFPSAWPMNNGMMSGLLAQQQQQLAYAALAAVLRKDMPNINDNQIRDMLPHIYNANPALMQKMSEIYKYAQPGMMNPMMHPMLASGGGGAGAAAAGGMSGASGLQYEPPWQRQQQQQQQQRLQQLLQQNPMGAKYYAGGLGSRDPVAMALQQQRAREMLTGERGRPRGRPPLQPRAPPTHHAGDVVNLDSD